MYSQYRPKTAETKKTRNVAIANALQLEVARATPVFFRFNYDVMPRRR